MNRPAQLRLAAGNALRYFPFEMRVPKETATFICQTTGWLATRDAANHPIAVEAIMVDLDPESGVGEIAAFSRFARHTEANLRENACFALLASRTWGDHRSVQIKGRCTELRGVVRDPSRVAGPLNALADALLSFGLPFETTEKTRNIAGEPYQSVRVQVDEVYDQTPGPGAGRRLP